MPTSKSKGSVLWPIFICYRQVDGLAAARRLHELLDKSEVTGPEGQTILLDVYLDQTMPAVADWREIHRPYLERARALIVVCTPGAKIDEGPEDWVHKEIGWWLEHRTTAPVLIDPLRQGIRYVPTDISQRWPEIQRIPLVEAEWAHLPEAQLREKSDALRRLIVGSLLPSGAAIYAAELEAERQRAERLELSQRVTQAALFDAQAAARFDEARRLEFRWEAERQRQIELQRNLGALSVEKKSSAFRKQNLAFEIRQLDRTMKELSAAAAGPRQQGYDLLAQANAAWEAIGRDGHAQAVASRESPNAPYIFSIEMINAGGGESILVHYGTPDDTRLVMLNGGTGARYKDSVRKRLQALKDERFAGAPTPIELFVASDQDEQKTGGLLKMLTETLDLPRADRVVDLHGVWVNVFETSGIRGAILERLHETGVPVNAPFDHHVMSPDRGLATCPLPGGLEIMVLGPRLPQLAALHRQALQNHRPHRAQQPPVDRLPEERFREVTVLDKPARLPAPPPDPKSGDCRPSDNARKRAKVAALDASVPNMASTVLLFRYRGRTFLHLGDSRADLILDWLVSSGLMEPQGRVHVDLLLLPHQGSMRNLTSEFLQRVTADSYLFSGDGRHFNPKVETIAALIAARPCAQYTMHFINRDSDVGPGGLAGSLRAGGAAVESSHAESIDMFFAAEEQYNPRYRRLFRATDDGSVIIDLLDRVTY
jgi:hypothetical protein